MCRPSFGLQWWLERAWCSPATAFVLAGGSQNRSHSCLLQTSDLGTCLCNKLASLMQVVVAGPPCSSPCFLLPDWLLGFHAGVCKSRNFCKFPSVALACCMQELRVCCSLLLPCLKKVESREGTAQERAAVMQLQRQVDVASLCQGSARPRLSAQKSFCALAQSDEFGATETRSY